MEIFGSLNYWMPQEFDFSTCCLLGFLIDRLFCWCSVYTVTPINHYYKAEHIFRLVPLVYRYKSHVIKSISVRTYENHIYTNVIFPLHFFGDLSLLSFLVTSFYTGDVMLLGSEMVVISVMDT